MFTAGLHQHSYSKSRWGVFLAASCALHVALLAGWQVPEVPLPAVTGGAHFTVLLSTPGQTSTETQTVAVTPAHAAAAQPLPPPVRQTKKAAPRQSIKPEMTRKATPPPRAAAKPAAPTTPRPSPPQQGHNSQVQAAEKSPATRHSDSAVRRQLIGHVQRELARHFSYPPRARRRGWQGTVVLGFNIESSGTIKDIRVAKSSGFTILDRAATASLYKVARVEAAQFAVWQQEMPLQLPVIYRLE